MTATETATASRPPVLLPGRRSELSRAEAEYFAPTKAGDDSGSGFAAFLDVINPLQHIPVVSTLYRELTGDTISPAARIAGAALYGGPIGAGIAIVGAVAEQVSGESPDQMLASAFGLGGDSGTTAVASASATPSGLIAEATTRAAEPARTAPMVLASAQAPTRPPASPTPASPTPASGASPAAASGVPQMSPAAFDALIRAMGGEPGGAESAAAAVVAAAPGPVPAGATAAAGSTEERRFFPARHTGVRAPRPVPMDVRPETTGNYDDVLRQMRQNIDRYTSAGIAAGGTGTSAAP